MKYKSYVFPLLLCFSFLLYSCKRHDEGFGGNAVIRGKVAHHGAAIPGAAVMIKFDARNSPGTDTTAYDASVMADSGGNYQVSGLKAGNYFLYGVGWDSSISQLVTGGIPVRLKSDDEVKNTDVPVTED